jgi:hypothetical protein
LGLVRSVSCGGATPIPPNARNAAEIHGFCAAVPEVRIHLSPAESQRDRRDKPISRNSLRKHFKKELETSATKLNAQVGNFMVSTIFGAKPPNGATPIRDERVRGRLGELFLKARLGWREIDLGSKRERRAERARNSAEPWEAQLKAHKDAKRSLEAKFARLARSIKAGETGGSSAG